MITNKNGYKDPARSAAGFVVANFLFMLYIHLLFMIGKLFWKITMY